MPGVPDVEPGVLEAIEEHTHSSPDRSAGGFLVGRPEPDGLKVQAALRALLAEDRGGGIIFPSQAWREAYETLYHSHPGAKIVGWYRSRPGSGATLSDLDRSMHAALFSEHHAVALILDPTINARAWFGWTLTHLPFDQETPESGQREAAAAAMAEARAGGLRRRSAASVLAAGLVVGALGGYLGGTATRQPTRTPSVRGTPVPTPEATRLRAQLETLKQQLRTNAERIAAADRKLQETKAQLRAARLATRPRVLMFRYRARPGDSLWRVAQIFYGTGLKWQLVWKANPSIHDPSRIQVGQILKVPLRTG